MSRIQQHLLAETMCIAAVAARAALWNDNFNDNHEITQRRSESICGEDPAVTSCSPGIERKRRNMGASCGLSSAEQQLPRRSKAGRIDRCRTKSANRQHRLETFKRWMTRALPASCGLGSAEQQLPTGQLGTSGKGHFSGTASLVAAQQ